MRRTLFLLTALFLFSAGCAYAQNYSKIQWSKEKMDSRWDRPQGQTTACSEALAKYKPSVDSLEIVVGYCPDGMTKNGYPCALSNMTVDIIKEFAQSYLDSKGKEENVALSLINYGGLRSNFVKGNVTVADVYSMYPFYNYVIVIDLKGKHIKTLFEMVARNPRVCAFGGAKAVIEDKKVKELKLDGKEIEDETVYKVATIDFLLNGGDGVYMLKYNDGVEEIPSRSLLRDVILDKFAVMKAEGRDIEWPLDDRLTVLENK